MTNIEIRALRFFRSDDGRRPYRTMALAEVHLADVDMTIRDVRLTWSGEKGFIATAPIPERCKVPPIQWNYRGDFGKALTAEVTRMWRAMGGKLPDERDEAASEWVCAPEGYHPDCSPQEAKRAAFTAIAAVEAANDDDALDGLRRTLRIEADEAERACG